MFSLIVIRTASADSAASALSDNSALNEFGNSIFHSNAKGNVLLPMEIFAGSKPMVVTQKEKEFVRSVLSSSVNSLNSRRSGKLNGGGIRQRRK